MMEPNYEKFKEQVLKLEGEIVDLEKKYGEAKWVTEKKTLLQSMIDFHDDCVDYKIATDVTIETYRLIQRKHEYDMPWAKVFKALDKQPPLVFDLIEKMLAFLGDASTFADTKDGHTYNKFLLEILNEKG